MTLNAADWLIILVYFAASAAIGIAYTKRGSQSLADYFASGRSLPWWLAGTSMVATTFAADTQTAQAAQAAASATAAAASGGCCGR